jgi:hypothetical protein
LIKRKNLATVMTVVLLATISVQPALVYSKSDVIKQSEQSTYSAESQGDLKVATLFSANPADLTGSLSQSSNDLNSLDSSSFTVSSEGLSRGSTSLSRSSVQSAVKPFRKIELMPWFGQVENIYAKGDVATVTDLATGLTMQIKRTGGTNHADVETLDAEGTATLLKIAGGEWNWTRRPIIVEIDGHRIAASLTARPHAGRDDMPAHETVNNRSGDYGTGVNWDSVKGNNMDGHFDIHFYGSRTHGSDRVDPDHQAAIHKAFNSGK